MATIKKVLTDILTQLATVTDLQHIRLWNNQLQQVQDGTIYSHPYPACFLEVQSSDFTRIGVGVNQTDLNLRIHIAHEFYDAQDGTFEQDLIVFDLRDKIINKLTNYRPTGCSILNFINEGQDYEHTNIYHYTIDFNCAFVDDAGSLIYTIGSASDAAISNQGTPAATGGLYTTEGAAIQTTEVTPVIIL